MKRLITLKNIRNTDGSLIIVEDSPSARKDGKLAGKRFFKQFKYKK